MKIDAKIRPIRLPLPNPFQVSGHTKRYLTGKELERGTQAAQVIR
jgi:hypothetical protein